MWNNNGGDSFGNNNNNSYSQGNNYNTSASQFAGSGGFMPGGLSQGSPSSASREQKGNQRPAQTLLPVTVKRLINANYQDSKFSIDGKEVKQVTFVGMILQVDAQATNTTYVIDDGTGQINVPKYSDSNDEKQSTLRENMYVRVFGNLRVFADNRSVVAFQLTPITDFNELTFHFLEVIHYHLLNTKSPQSGQGQQGQVVKQDNQNFTNNMGNGTDDQAFSDIQQSVLQIFSADQTDQGASINTVCQQLGHIPLPEIRKAVDFLVDEGHLYSTIDEDHFKATSSF